MAVQIPRREDVTANLGFGGFATSVTKSSFVSIVPKALFPSFRCWFAPQEMVGQKYKLVAIQTPRRGGVIARLAPQEMVDQEYKPMAIQTPRRGGVTAHLGF